VDAIANSLAWFGGIAAVVLVSVAAGLLHRRKRSWPTFMLVGGMAILSVGLAIQLLAPRGDFSYVLNDEEIVGATGTFSTMWYVGSIVFYAGLLLAGAGFLAHALFRKGGRANDA
jgi:hypothetical protein